MKKRILSLALTLCLLAGLLPCLTVGAAAADRVDAAPYASVEYAKNADVKTGTVRYVCQVPAYSDLFCSDYWGSYGNYANHECFTACISMALSYLGLDATPGALGDYWLNRGHYVMIIGQVSATEYRVLDPAVKSIYSMTLTNGSTVHYFKGSERVTEAVQYYYPVHHWSAWTAIETDDGAVNMERTCVDCGKTETARIPDPCVGDEYCAGGVFDDMPAASDWMHEGIDYCVLFGLMNGVGKNQFDPMGQTTRAMLVSILYRMAGEPDVSELPEAPFVDVSDDTWYTAAVRWAYANEVVLGTDDTHFAPDARLTRAQLVTMLYRAYGPEKGVRPRPIGGYTDWNTVPDWAYSATTWAVSMGILYGTSSTELSPNTGANRAQLALFMMRTCRLQGELDS